MSFSKTSSGSSHRYCSNDRPCRYRHCAAAWRLKWPSLRCCSIEAHAPGSAAGGPAAGASGISNLSRAERIFPAQRYTLLSCTADRMRCIRRFRSAGDIPMASRIASASSSIAYGLNRRASLSLESSPGKLAQEQDAILVRPASDELLGNQVHSIMKRADDAEVSQTMECSHLHRREVPLEVNHGAPPLRSPFPVEPLDLTVDLLVNLLI